MEQDYNNYELYHHGIKGMRWGVRRFQNKDGSLTPAGEKRRSLGEVVHDYKVKRKRKQALEKARATKQANKEAEKKQAEEAEKRKKLIEQDKLSAKKMTNEELQYALARKRAEQEYQQRVLETNTGKRIAHKIINDGIVPGVTEGAKNLVKDLLYKKGSEALGISKKEVKSLHDRLKEEAEIAKFRKNAYADTKALKKMIANDAAGGKSKKKEEKKQEKESKKEEKKQEKQEKKQEKESKKKEKNRSEGSEETNESTSKTVNNDNDTSNSSYTSAGETTALSIVRNMSNTRFDDFRSERRADTDRGEAWVESATGEWLTNTTYRDLK